jgi:hypothetical protein
MTDCIFQNKTTARCGHINTTCINISLLTAHELPQVISSGSFSVEDVVYSNGISAGSTGKRTACWRTATVKSAYHIPLARISGSGKAVD